MLCTARAEIGAAAKRGEGKNGGAQASHAGMNGRAAVGGAITHAQGVVGVAVWKVHRAAKQLAAPPQAEPVLASSSPLR